MLHLAFIVRLVEEEGFDPTADEYYTEVDRQIIVGVSAKVRR